MHQLPFRRLPKPEKQPLKKQPLRRTNSIRRWKEEMDGAGIDWRFNNHGNGVDHGFALAPGCFNNVYHEAADRRSTLSMLSLFAECWPEVEQRSVHTNACGTVLNQAVVAASKL